MHLKLQYDIDYNAIYAEKNMHPSLFSVCGMSPYPGHNTSPRIQMYSAQLGQCLVINNPTLRYQQTGMEYEFGKYTFHVSFPTDANIIKVLHLYNKTMDNQTIDENPEDVIIYEDPHTNIIDALVVPRFKSLHPHFGFLYKQTKAYSEIGYKNNIPKDTIILDSPNKLPNGGYMYGRELQVAFMSHEAIADDGIAICEDVLDDFAYTTFERRVLEWGSKRVMLNMYGDEFKFQGFPEIGQTIREDGIVAAFRTMDKTLGPVEQSIYDMMVPCNITDRIIYAPPGSVVIDIRVDWVDGAGNNTLVGTDDQVMKYRDATHAFFTKLFGEYKRLQRERGKNLKIGDEFNRLINKAQEVTVPITNPRLIKLHRSVPIDDYRVEITLMCRKKNREGAKFSDCHGGKGVITRVLKRSEMPVDKNGVSADMIFSGKATINRTNFGRFYEHYFNSASHCLIIEFRKRLVVPGVPHTIKSMTQQYNENNHEFMLCFNTLMHYYKILSPIVHERMLEANVEQVIKHMWYILQPHHKGIHLQMPTDNPRSYYEAARVIRNNFRPLRDHVTYMHNGRLVTSKEKVNIGSLYIIFLEKTGDDWSSVASGKLQIHGLLAQITKVDKHTTPTREQTIRILAEAENRNFNTTIPEDVCAEINDRNNNPVTHKEIVFGLMTHQTPSNIDRLVDRNKIPLGNPRPLQLFRHMATCAGWKFVYTPDPHHLFYGYLDKNNQSLIPKPFCDSYWEPLKDFYAKKNAS